MAAFLIVDPDRSFREALAIALRLDGHHASVASSVDEARERLSVARYDCCAVDAHLAGADALLESVAASGARALATGRYADLLQAAQPRHPGARALVKPFRVSDLAALAAAPAPPVP